MGASMVYLEKPNTEVEFQSGESKQHKVRYVAAEMQGWRLNMVSEPILIKWFWLKEDAHISNLEFDQNQALFAVFDGHGGREVAHYAKKHFEKILKSEDNYIKGDLKEALRKGFLKVDESLN